MSAKRFKPYYTKQLCTKTSFIDHQAKIRCKRYRASDRQVETMVKLKERWCGEKYPEEEKARDKRLRDANKVGHLIKYYRFKCENAGIDISDIVSTKVIKPFWEVKMYWTNEDFGNDRELVLRFTNMPKDELLQLIKRDYPFVKTVKLIHKKAIG